MLYYLAQEREKKMDKLKKYASYFVLLIVFFIFSNFLIYVGLNSNYRDINRQDNIGEVYVYQAQATKVTMPRCLPHRSMLQGKCGICPAIHGVR